VKNSVGAGDSAVAGFLAGWLREKNAERALAVAVAAGSATAFSESIAEGETVASLFSEVKITRIS
jgi:1-phosphofructokinase